MNLSDRIKIILIENKLKQKEFAKEIGVTESYISAIINGRNTNLSQSLSSLIEEKYGYNAEWVLKGTEPKLKQFDISNSLSDVHKKAISKLEKMSNEQIKSVIAFMNSLDEVEKNIRG